jgi:hypothetical protein
MKKISILIIAISALFLAQCNEPASKVAQEQMQNEQMPQDTLINQNKPFYQGTIMETIDAGGYTYLKIKEDLDGHVHEEGHEHKDFWIAVEKTPAKVGDVVRFQKELVTEQFYSKILDRTFDELMFASNLQHKVE